jgi:ABC-type Zn uptake system ZnuABC Zn-binding protein ZnuA
MTAPILKHIVIIAFTVLAGQSVLATDRLGVFVSIAPQKYFVQQIGRRLVGQFAPGSRQIQGAPTVIRRQV